MATFNPYNSSIKESINVDFKDRHSPQKVILCNRENQFYGTFYGRLNACSVDINGGIIKNATLSNVNLGGIDLSGLQEQITEFQTDFDLWREEIIPGMSSDLDQAISDIQVLSNRIKNQGNSFLSTLSTEIESREKQFGLMAQIMDGISSDLKSQINDETESRENMDSSLCAKIDNTKNELLQSLQDGRHYGAYRLFLENVDEIKKYAYCAEDFGSNIISAKLPFGKVFAIENGKTETREIGFIDNVQKTGDSGDGSISSFTLFINPDCPIKEFGNSDGIIPYHFSVESQNIPSWTAGYKLCWDLTSNPIVINLKNDMDYDYLSTEYMNNPAGEIVDFGFDGDVLSSGKIVFKTDSIPAINEMEFEFDSENNERIYEYGDRKTKVIFQGDEERFLVRDNFTAEMYQSLSSDDLEFARIYESDVQYSGDKVSGATVKFDTQIGEAEISDDVALNVGDIVAFRSGLFAHMDYGDNDELAISVGYDKRIYGSEVKLERTVGTPPIREIVGSFKFLDGAISSFSEHTRFQVTIDEGTLSGVYVLNYNEFDGRYCYDGAPGSGIGSLTLRYYPTENERMWFIHRTDFDVVGSFILDVEDIRPTDESVLETVLQSEIQTDENGKVVFPLEDPKETEDKIITYNPEPISGDGKVRYYTKTVSGNQINVLVPEKIDVLREFILYFETGCEKLQVNIFNRFGDACTYSINGYTLKTSQENEINSKTLIVQNKKPSAFRFQEVDSGEFIIDDMENVNLIEYINQRFRGGVKYMGTVFVNKTTEQGRTGTLPELFNENGFQKLFRGNMFLVKKADEEVDTRWTIDGVELEHGDYIIFNKDFKNWHDVVSDDIDVVDTIEKDKIIVDFLEVLSSAYINSLSVGDVSANSIDVGSLSADYSYVNRSTIKKLDAGEISVGLNDLNLVNEGVVSTALEISTDLRNDIDANREDIDQISSDLSGLSSDYETVKSRYNKTLWPSLSGEDYPVDEYPEYLVLRDQVNTDNIYALEIRDGVLAVKLLKNITH